MTRHNPAPSTSARHRTDILSLIFGLLFLSVAGWWAASYYLDWIFAWNLPDVGWLLAAGLIILGLIGIIASLRRTRTDAAAPVSLGPVATTAPGADAAPGEGLVRPGEPTTDLNEPDPTADLDRPEVDDEGGHRPA